MKKLAYLYENVFDKISKLDFLVLLLIRVTLAQVFIESGWGKLHNLSKIVEYFTSLGIPAPAIQAPFVAGVEFFGGIAILLGLATRFVSIPLSITMVVALLTAKLSDITSFSKLTEISEYLYILLFTVLIVFGAGKISLDYFLRKKLRDTSFPK